MFRYPVWVVVFFALYACTPEITKESVVQIEASIAIDEVHLVHDKNSMLASTAPFPGLGVSLIPQRCHAHVTMEIFLPLLIIPGNIPTKAEGWMRGPCDNTTVRELAELVGKTIRCSGPAPVKQWFDKDGKLVRQMIVENPLARMDTKNPIDLLFQISRHENCL
ncbi:MAG: hypothetical protein AAB355_01315 [Patescibacteria group bacterium]